MEAIGNVARRLVEQARDRREAMARGECQNDLPTMQRGAEEEARPMPERNGHGRGGGVDLLALRDERRGEV